VRDHHVIFDPAALTPTIAHHGVGTILANRALVATDGIACRFIDQVIVPAGTSIGLHTHDEKGQELYIIVDGSAQVYLNGSEFTARTGDVVVNRPAGTHGLTNRGPDPLTLVVIEVPVGGSGQGAARSGETILVL
jgi:mannose-6-phosphate isomerase-like protein (cupin superfamily)